MFNKTINTAIGLILSTTLMACGEAESEQVNCGQGKSIEKSSNTYCVFKSPITEEGFTCPADASIGRRYGQLVVCTNDNADIPPEVFDDVIELYPNEMLPSGACKAVVCDLDKTCSDGQCKAKQSEEACLMSCGDGCPAPEFQTCASDGQRYCNECVISCKGLTKAEESKCGNPQSMDACIMNCGDPTSSDWVCGDDGKEYASECILNCKSIAKAADQTSCSSKDQISCDLACGVGCPAPEFQLCAEDGQTYCNSCNVYCADTKQAADQSSCE